MKYIKKKNITALILPLCLAAICSSFFNCANIEDFNNAGESYYMPDIDIFIIRCAENEPQGDVRFVTPSDADAANYVKRAFTGEIGDTNSINHWLYTLSVGFYHSRIRIFHIMTDAYSGNPDDFLPSLSSTSFFTLTDNDCTGAKGTVYNEDGPMKLFLAGDTETSADYSGIAWVRGKGILILSGTSGLSSFKTFCYVLAHEMGHNFSLMHPFDTCSGVDRPCECASQGSTNRVMDYTSGATEFIPCERLQAELFCKVGYGFSKSLHDTEREPNFKIYRGNWTGTITVGKSGSAPLIPADAYLEADRWNFK